MMQWPFVTPNPLGGARRPPARPEQTTLTRAEARRFADLEHEFWQIAPGIRLTSRRRWLHTRTWFAAHAYTILALLAALAAIAGAFVNPLAVIPGVVALLLLEPVRARRPRRRPAQAPRARRAP